MKKYLVLFGCLSLIAFVVMLFGGCTTENTKEKVSDMRYGIFDGSCENYNATFVYGMRENPYLLDGNANKTVEFGIISVCFNEKLKETDIVNYSIKINDKTLTGKLEKNPYSNEYMADIGMICSDDSSISLSINVNDKDANTIEMENKNSSWEINSEKALDIGLEALKDNLESIKKKNENYEIQVKISTQQNTNFGKYYWVVTIASKTEKHNVIFTTQSEEILVKN